MDQKGLDHQMAANYRTDPLRQIRQKDQPLYNTADLNAYLLRFALSVRRSAFYHWILYIISGKKPI